MVCSPGGVTAALALSSAFPNSFWNIGILLCSFLHLHDKLKRTHEHLHDKLKRTHEHLHDKLKRTHEHLHDKLKCTHKQLKKCNGGNQTCQVICNKHQTVNNFQLFNYKSNALVSFEGFVDVVYIEKKSVLIWHV